MAGGRYGERRVARKLALGISLLLLTEEGVTKSLRTFLLSPRSGLSFLLLFLFPGVPLLTIETYSVSPHKLSGKDE